MSSEKVNYLILILWVFGAFFGGVFLITAILAGFMLAVMMGAIGLVSAPLIFTVAAVEKVREHRRVQVIAGPDVAVVEAREAAAVFEAEPATALHVEGAPLAPVIARVINAHGTCPLGFAFHVGDVFAFTNGSVSPALCKRADKALRPIIEDLRAGKYPTIELPYCQTKQHSVVFELEKSRIAQRV